MPDKSIQSEPITSRIPVLTFLQEHNLEHIIKPLRKLNGTISGGFALREFLDKDWEGDIDIWIPLQIPRSYCSGKCPCYTFEMHNMDLYFRKELDVKEVPCFCGKHNDSFNLRKTKTSNLAKQMHYETNRVVELFSEVFKDLQPLRCNKYDFAKSFRLIAETVVPSKTFVNGLTVQIFVYPTKLVELGFHEDIILPKTLGIYDIFDYSACAISWHPDHNFSISDARAISDATNYVIYINDKSETRPERAEDRREKYMDRGFTILNKK